MASKTFSHLKTEADLSSLLPYLVEKPLPLSGRETLQIILIREIQDYTILRTEETRELNTVWTPAKPDGTGEVERVAFLATKQKGAESRELESLLRTWGDGAPKRKECYLKSQLCLECPRCILFGATDTSKGGEKKANIKHRIAYGTAFSLLPVDPALRENHTFNGVDGATQLTGSTLGDRESVRPGNLFASIVTLRAVTEIELVLALKTLLSCTRYGAEPRIGGIVRNHVVGLVAAHEEILSPLELTLEIADANDPPSMNVVKSILDRYKERSATPSKVEVLPAETVKALLDGVQKIDMSQKPIFESAYTLARDFRTKQASYLKKTKKEKAS
jgi:CRISPR type I-D-associated protein Csc2